MSQESKERVKTAAEREFLNSLRGESLSPDEIRQKLEKFSATLKVRPLDYEAYAKMPYAEKSFHEFANSANVDKALDAHQGEQRKTSKGKDADISRQYVNQTPEENAACQAVAEQFTSRYKHFLRIPENSSALADRMKQKNLNPLDVNSFIRAFEELAVEGRIVLDGKTAGICEDAMVGGHELRTHKELYRFLKPTPSAAQLEQYAASKMSADQWKRSRPELADPTPFVMQQQIVLSVRSLPHFEPDYVPTEENGNKLLQYVSKNNLQFNLTGLRVAFNALKDKLELKPHTAEGQITQYTEYDDQNHGEPEAPGKLATKVRSMSSDQYLAFLRNNKSARAAIDGV